MKFLLLHYFDEGELDCPAEPDDTDPTERELAAWVAEMESAGVKLHGGRLRPGKETVTLRVPGGQTAADGRPIRGD